ncbi:cadmium resistance transporter [Chondromyces apiculatus]|uniref:Cadmium resistance transporter n=1 Tax=Chondromyces apiculatus DSM 436 TaxID=1192034 RepID=A0A017TG06_9BACT|nr:cadmium resistance transporter [Chondromyces apiculatus]EYF08159.1 Cadmium resistance transporter [Chondromyces apiculatus DSM 436]
MNQLVSTLGVSALVFVSTNIDDILLLAAFFADPTFTRRQIVTGQLLGIGALTLGSALCALLAFAVPEGWLGLIGLVPLALGLRGLWALRPGARRDGDGDDDSDDGPQRPRSQASGVLAVAGVTLANGGDNLGVYIPLFSSAPRLIPVHVVVFVCLTLLWCALGYWLVNNPLLGARIRRYGGVLLPFVLIGLGLWILADARVLLGP